MAVWYTIVIMATVTAIVTAVRSTNENIIITNVIDTTDPAPTTESIAAIGLIIVIMVTIAAIDGVCRRNGLLGFWPRDKCDKPCSSAPAAIPLLMTARQPCPGAGEMDGLDADPDSWLAARRRSAKAGRINHGIRKTAT